MANWPVALAAGATVTSAHYNSLVNAIWNYPIGADAVNANNVNFTGVGSFACASFSCTGAFSAASIGSTEGTAEAKLFAIATGAANSARLQLIGRQANVNSEWNLVAVGSGAGAENLVIRKGTWTAGTVVLTISPAGALTAASSITAGGAVAAAFKANRFGTAAGTAWSGTPAVADSNIVLYENTSTNWAGIGTDSGGNLWFKVGLAGAVKPMLALTTNRDVVVQAANLAIDDVAGTDRVLWYRRNGLARWSIFCTSTAESGSAAGSDLAFGRCDDAGTFLGFALNITRATGLVTMGTLLLNATPVHADNPAAVAAGLAAGRIYRTTSGVLMQVY